MGQTNEAQLLKELNDGKNKEIVKFDIASGGTTSNSVFFGKDTLLAILFPAAMTSTAVDIQVSSDGVNFYSVESNVGISFSALTVSVDTWISLDPAITLAYPYIRIVAGSSEGADREIKAIKRYIN